MDQGESCVSKRRVATIFIEQRKLISVIDSERDKIVGVWGVLLAIIMIVIILVIMMLTRSP